MAPSTHAAALALARTALAKLPAILGAVDALLVPAVRGEAPAGLDSTGDPLFCRAWTLLGTLTVAVPAGVGANGLPIGVQLVGRPGEDRAPIALAGRLHLALAERSPVRVSRTPRGGDRQ